MKWVPRYSRCEGRRGPGACRTVMAVVGALQRRKGGGSAYEGGAHVHGARVSGGLMILMFVVSGSKNLCLFYIVSTFRCSFTFPIYFEPGAAL